MQANFPDEIDISQLSVEALEELFFNHPDGMFGVNKSTQLQISNPEKSLLDFTRMFENFEEIGKKYSMEQIDAGIWLLMGQDQPTPSLPECLLQRTVYVFKDGYVVASLEKRLNCIEAIYCVYRDFVSKVSGEICMANCFYMWFDNLSTQFWCHVESVHTKDELSLLQFDDDEKAVFEKLFDTLERILNLNEERCQIFALHGLGHLQHPKTFQLVQNHIDSNIETLDEEQLTWLRQCQNGTVM